MRAEYDLQPEDLAAFHIHHDAHAPENRRARRHIFWLGMSALVLVCATIAISSAHPLQAFATWWPLVLLPLVFALLPYWQVSRAMRKPIEQQVRRTAHAGQLGRQEIELTPDSVRLKSRDGATELRWRAVQRIESSPEHLLIYIGPQTAILAPRRTFANAAEFDAFETEARRLHAQAGSDATDSAT